MKKSFFRGKILKTKINIFAIAAIVIFCLLCSVILTGCFDFNKDDKEEKVLTIYAEGPFHVNSRIGLVAKWQNGEVANAFFRLSQPSAVAYISDNGLYVSMPGKYSVYATAENVTSQTLEITATHTPESLRSAFDYIFSDVTIDLEYHFDLTADYTAEISNTDIAALTDGKLVVTGIGETDLIIKHNNNVFLTYTVSTVNSFTQIFLNEMKDKGVIEADATQATVEDMARVTELDLNGKLYNHKGKENILRKFVNLEKLYIADCNIRALDFLTELTNLEYLDASGNLIASLFSIRGLSALKYLDISDNAFSGNAFDDLLAFTLLETLKVGGNELPEGFGDIVIDLYLTELDTENYNARAMGTLSEVPIENLAEYNSANTYNQQYYNNEQNLKPYVRIDLSQKTTESGAIVIPPKAEAVEIIGNSQNTFNICVTIMARSTPVMLIINNLRTNAPDNTEGIYAPNDCFVQLVVIGENRIRGGMNRSGISSGFIEIIGDIINPELNKLYVWGGNGANGTEGAETKSESNNTRKGHPGNDGGSGICATMYDGLVIRRLQTLSANGGNGGNGGQGGKYKTENVFNPTTWMKKSGDGGNGGKGGAGYLGKNYIAIGAVPQFVGGSGGQGGESGYSVDSNFRGNRGTDGIPGQATELYQDLYYSY